MALHLTHTYLSLKSTTSLLNPLLTSSVSSLSSCHHIKPDSVNSYISCICQQLEPYFPNVRDVCKSILCKQTLTGCKRLRGVPTKCKRALTMDNLWLVTHHYSTSQSHNDLLFISQLLTGFFALMHMGELTISDNKSLSDHRKITSRTLVLLSNDDYHFFLPSHKADKFFEGNIVIIQHHDISLNPLFHFRNYLASRDQLSLFLPTSGSALMVPAPLDLFLYVK